MRTAYPSFETTSYSLVDDPDSEQAGRIDCYPDSELEELIAAGLDTASDPLATGSALTASRVDRTNAQPGSLTRHRQPSTEMRARGGK